MFGSNRRKAVAHVVERLRPLVGTVSNFHGIPAGFWNDEFVLGFFYLMIAFHLNETSGLQLSQTDKGCALSDILTALSNMNGLELARRATELRAAQPENKSFKLGRDNAHIIAYFTIGKLSDEGRSAYEDARITAANQGQAQDFGAVAGILFMNLFMAPLRQRFD